MKKPKYSTLQYIYALNDVLREAGYHLYGKYWYKKNKDGKLYKVDGNKRDLNCEVEQGDYKFLTTEQMCEKMYEILQSVENPPDKKQL